MAQAFAVIGANYGDEGKGHITDYLSDENTLVIRFNGGAQASHTVVTSDGRQHVFHHFGSGTIQGARTLLGRHFIVNPLVFVDELGTLLKKVAVKPVLIDPRCRVTTPYDMVVNAFTSQYFKKNDTCGQGINETVERSKFKELRITMRNLLDMSETQLRERLRLIENEWLSYRIDALKLPADDFKRFASRYIFHDDLETSFINLAKKIAERSAVWNEEHVIDKFLSKSGDRKLVFEGAQGMLLDQHRKEFYPYLTRSSTGIDNVLHALHLVSTPMDLTVYLVTRTYLSRHGDGPLWNAVDQPYAKVSDETNQTNQFQGTIRYGYLDRGWIKKALIETREKAEKRLPNCIDRLDVCTAVTCLDQLDGYNVGKPIESTVMYSETSDTGYFSGAVCDAIPDIKLFSTGPTELDVTLHGELKEARDR